MTKRFYVYILFREDGRPFYVGKGTGDRWISHEKKDCKYLDTYKDRIIRKMMEEGRTVKRVKFADNLAESTAFVLEMLLIKRLGRHPHGPLANATDGGEGVRNLSAESKAKISRAQMGNRYGVGRKNSPEQIAKLTEARRNKGYKKETYDKIANKLRGRKHSDEHRKKISLAGTGRKMSDEARRNMALCKMRENLSEETRRKRSESLKGRKISETSRERMRKSRLAILEKENQIPEAVEARRKAASLAGFARWEARKVQAII